MAIETAPYIGVQIRCKCGSARVAKGKSYKIADTVIVQYFRCRTCKARFKALLNISNW